MAPLHPLYAGRDTFASRWRALRNFTKPRDDRPSTATTPSVQQASTGSGNPHSGRSPSGSSSPDHTGSKIEQDDKNKMIGCVTGAASTRV